MIYWKKYIFLIFTFIIGLPLTSDAQEDSIKIGYSNNGLELSTGGDNFLIQLQSRLQFRFSTPQDDAPILPDDISQENKFAFNIRRARLKIGGHTFQPWVRYYWEYELANANLLDFRIMLEKWEWLSLKVGQWKVEFNRERRISSGEQQTVGRSIINRPFTVDRQQGLELYGHIEGWGAMNLNYWFAILTGTGRSNPENDDNKLMYFGKIQWNFLGYYIDFVGSDIDIRTHPAAIIAISGLTNTSPYTRFSQEGGGQLEGYTEENPGQYSIKQANIESAFMYRGFSWQSDAHYKQIIDNKNDGRLTILQGYYFQAGYFFHQLIHAIPKKLEFAMRYSNYIPNRNIPGTIHEEFTTGFNWFFNGHRNKLTTEVSYFDFKEDHTSIAHEWRFRTQWDISF